MLYKKDTTKLEIYNETFKRRTLVGLLSFDEQEQCYTFRYEMDFMTSKQAIPLGVELPLLKQTYETEDEEIFPTFADRIPPRTNPAYPEYCESQGITADETNPIILLGTIGRRGPSSFVFEAVFLPEKSVAEELKAFRKRLDISRWEFAEAFGMQEQSIARIETGASHDRTAYKLVELYLTVPEAALWQLELTGKKVHAKTRTKLYLDACGKLEKK